MNFKKPININYCATVSTVTSIIPLVGCDNIVGALVAGSQVVVDKSTKVGDIGIFFPVETKLNQLFLKSNSLYRDNTLNANPEKKGYFEVNGRIRCVAFRGNKSEGIFLPLTSTLAYGEYEFNIGDEFDTLNNISVCEKYIPKASGSGKNPSTPGVKKPREPKRHNRLVDNQFRLHYDTAQLKKNAHRIQPMDIISITNKLHGSSNVFANILTKRPLNFIEKVLTKLNVKIITEIYDYVYSSRTVIKNKWYKKDQQHYYGTDIWGRAAKELIGKIPNGFTIYSELVGYTENGKDIQPGYTYNCEQNTFKQYIYRVTFTNNIGEVYELDFMSLIKFCEKYNLSHVPLFYYGYAKDCFPEIIQNDDWSKNFVDKLDKSFNMNDAMCELNNNKVPAEGCVVRIENIFGPIAFKLKNYKFMQRETKELDKGTIDIETEQSESIEENA